MLVQSLSPAAPGWVTEQFDPVIMWACVANVNIVPVIYEPTKEALRAVTAKVHYNPKRYARELAKMDPLREHESEPEPETEEEPSEDLNSVFSQFEERDPARPFGKGVRVKR
jgi:hypothetical protein